jgi:hypothetical protein
VFLVASSSAPRPLPLPSLCPFAVDFSAPSSINPSPAQGTLLRANCRPVLHVVFVSFFTIDSVHFATHQTPHQINCEDSSLPYI